MAFITLSGKRAKKKSAALSPPPVSSNVLRVELSYLAAAVDLDIGDRFLYHKYLWTHIRKKKRISHTASSDWTSCQRQSPSWCWRKKNVWLFKMKPTKCFPLSPFIFAQLPPRTAASGGNNDFGFINRLARDTWKQTPGDGVLLVLEKIYDPH